MKVIVVVASILSILNASPADRPEEEWRILLAQNCSPKNAVPKLLYDESSFEGLYLAT